MPPCMFSLYLYPPLRIPICQYSNVYVSIYVAIYLCIHEYLSLPLWFSLIIFLDMHVCINKYLCIWLLIYFYQTVYPSIRQTSREVDTLTDRQHSCKTLNEKYFENGNVDVKLNSGNDCRNSASLSSFIQVYFYGDFFFFFFCRIKEGINFRRRK